MNSKDACPSWFRDRYDVSRETCADLDFLAVSLKKWSKRINLVSRSTLDDVWERHIADSVQLSTFIPKNGSQMLDLGTGGGFPGLVLAIIDRQKQPDRRYTFLESDQRKGVFLQKIIMDLSLNADVVSERIEHANPAQADVITARALASIDDLLAYSERHRKKDGVCLFLKGQTASEELTAARKNWHVEAEFFPSTTAPNGIVVKIGSFQRASI